MTFPTPEQQFAAAMAARPQSTFPRRPTSNQLPAWMREDEPQGDMEDMLAEHGTYRALNGSVL